MLHPVVVAHSCCMLNGSSSGASYLVGGQLAQESIAHSVVKRMPSVVQFHMVGLWDCGCCNICLCVPWLSVQDWGHRLHNSLSRPLRWVLSLIKRGMLESWWASRIYQSTVVTAYLLEYSGEGDCRA